MQYTKYKHVNNSQLFEWSLQPLLVHVWVFSRYFGFFPHIKNKHLRFIGNSHLSLGENGSLFVSFWPLKKFQPVHASLSHSNCEK